jgi:hypothetical protein
MAIDFWIKRNATRPKYRCELKGPDGVAVDLTNVTTVKFHFEKPDGTKVNGAAEKVNPPGTDGIVEYTWVATDTDTKGTIKGEWDLTYNDASKLTIPNGEANWKEIGVTEDIEA